MKKMKGVAVSVEYYRHAMYEDRRARFKHHSLLQDFQDLHKETVAIGQKLQMLKERKSTLLAEVRFLKRRCKFLMQNQSSNTREQRFFGTPQNTVIGSKPDMKGKQSTGKEHSLQYRATGFDLNQKGKTYSEKEEVTLRTSLLAFDLNQKETVYSEKDAAARSTAPVFDLNQISTEEEELQANINSMRIEELKKSSCRNGNDDEHNYIKLSACWNTGNGPSRVGKRKITWQDQVALRV